jgi:PAS domain S-box-containing protein
MSGARPIPPRGGFYSMSIKKLFGIYYDKMQDFIDAIRVGIFVADGQGNVLMVNDESEKWGGMSKAELVGRNIRELQEIGYLRESTILNSMKSLKEESVIQTLGSGEKQFITGVPLFRDGKIELFVCTERDITETIKLQSLLDETERIAEKYESELEYLRGKHIDMDSRIVVQSAEMRTIMDLATRVAGLDITVLLTGESGTGKELIANFIHKNSSREKKAFIKINCAAIPEALLESELFGYEKGAFTGADKNGKAGLFELANEGTLFLDEIGDMSMQMQSKLLRVLQEHEVMRIGAKQTVAVDARIIAATNVNLKGAVSEGRFREDLYYRLNVIPIEVPPLRRRKDDVEGLSRFFVELFNKEYHMCKRISREGIDCLKNYEWPGNVRELRNIIERIMISFDGPELTKFQISNQLNQKTGADERTGARACEGTLSERIAAYEKDLLSELMQTHKCGSRVAEILGVNKSTVSRKLRMYGIEAGE